MVPHAVFHDHPQESPRVGHRDVCGVDNRGEELHLIVCGGREEPSVYGVLKQCHTAVIVGQVLEDNVVPGGCFQGVG